MSRFNVPSRETDNPEQTAALIVFPEGTRDADMEQVYKLIRQHAPNGTTISTQRFNPNFGSVHIYQP